jgi:Domain of unknown function DUF29
LSSGHRQQAEALRAGMRDSSNQRLDWENLAEEIEDLEKSVRRELQSQIRRVVRHLLKLEHSPAKDPRRGWEESTVDARAEIEDLLEASPSLRTGLDRDIERQTQRGIDLASRDLARRQELDAATIAALRAASFTESRSAATGSPRSRGVARDNHERSGGDISPSGSYVLYRRAAPRVSKA